MRRTAPFPAASLLAAALLLSGCATHVGSPADGLGGFLGDVFSWRGAPNRPTIDSPNARRITGTAEEVEPLQTEPGNVWPGPLAPPRTMSDMQREMGNPLPPIDAPSPRGSSSPPPSLPPAAAPARPAAAATLPPPVPAAPAGRILQTPQGPATTTIGGNGVETYTLPSGRTGIVMPNANGTLTLIGPDGTTQTIAAPR
jgi:hypothetical protein